MSFKEAFRDWWEDYHSIVISGFAITLVIMLAIAFLGLLMWLCVSCASNSGPSHRDQLMYNNGIHNNCGGKWYFIEDNEDSTITYKCDKCGVTFTANDVVVIKGE